MIKKKINIIPRTIILFITLILSITLPTGTLEAQTYGNTWRNGNVTAEIVFRDVCFTGTGFIAVGDGTVVYISSNGATWARQNIGTPAGQSAVLFGVTAGEGKIVAVGSDHLVMTSANGGVSWTITNPRTNDRDDEDIYDIAYGNGVFVAAGEFGGTWRSPDGENWTKSGVGRAIRDIAFGNGVFMAVAANGSVYRTADGVSWTSKAVGQTLMSIHYGNSLWVAVGSKIWTSTNGTTWTQRLDVTGCNYHFYCVTSAPGTFIAASDSGKIVTSGDGITWRQPNSGSIRLLLGAAYGNNRVVVVGNGGPRNNNPLFLHS
ncbi:MAG: hypothetical protein GY757_56415, partial [bacterium]|nr:hypothetical protein [bacterium]